MVEARAWYDQWCSASLLERASIRGEPSEQLQGESYVRLEARALAMLCKAVPSQIYDLALSARNTTTVGIIFLILKTYQPGGLMERSELLKGLTHLQTADSATTGVSVIQRWFRHLERARTMSVSVPDCSLLIDALDRMSGSLLEKHPTMLFRVHAIRMQLQLDTVPSMTTTEQFARSLLAEFEGLAVSGADAPPKRPKVAALTDKGGDKGKKGDSKVGGGKSERQQKEACRNWASEGGCKRGKLCLFSHSLEKPGCCWTCGGNHQKQDCTAPGGGKGPAVDAKARTASSVGSAKEGGKAGDGKKGGGKTVNPKNPPTSTEQSAALKEAAQLLQSLRLSKVCGPVGSLKQLQRLSDPHSRRGLIDGGATACLRTACESELNLPVIPVQLATGEGVGPSSRS